LLSCLFVERIIYANELRFDIFWINYCDKKKNIGKQFPGDGEVVHYYKAKFKKTISGPFFDIDCGPKNIKKQHELVWVTL